MRFVVISCRFVVQIFNAMNTTSQLNKIKTQLPDYIKIVAVSKTKPAELIKDLYTNSGHKIFGENRVQELCSKHTMLPLDIEWHLIGHLQSNKIKHVAPFVGMIQSVDSFRLLMQINKEAAKCKRIIPCLLQFHIAREEAKFGFTIEEVEQMLNDNLFYELSNITIKGVMGIATYTSDQSQIKSEFRTLYRYFEQLRSNFFSGFPDFCEVSMGMTNDYIIAADEGSTIVRVGSGIFGVR